MPPLEDITAGHSIANLVTTNPADGDDVAQGDDHIRNLKKSLQFTFPNLASTVSASALELDIAHKGGTISGSLRIMSTLSVSGAAVMKAAVTMESTLDVAGALSASTVNAYQFYSGYIQSTGAAVALPTGWTATRSGTGFYRITHNLGDLSATEKHAVSPVLIINGATTLTINLRVISSNYFEIATLNSDRPFSFTFFRKP